MNTKLLFRVLEDRGTSFLISEDGEKSWFAETSGNLKKSESQFQPTVGDWVQGTPQPGDWIYIEAVEERKNLLTRQAVGGTGLQKLGANIDYLFIATALNQDFNLNRLDRYVAMALSCKIQPVILLTKVDLVDNPLDFLDQTARRFSSVDVHGVSAKEGWNIEALEKYLLPDITVALVGSSGVGKSTLVNHLIGKEVLDTGGIREDDDQTEPGCRILNALESGELEESRWNSFLKLKKEENFHRRKVDKVAASQEKKKWKSIHKQFRNKSRSHF